MENTPIVDEGVTPKKNVLLGVTPASRVLVAILFVASTLTCGWIGYTFTPEKVIYQNKVDHWPAQWDPTYIAVTDPKQLSDLVLNSRKDRDNYTANFLEDIAAWRGFSLYKIVHTDATSLAELSPPSNMRKIRGVLEIDPNRGMLADFYIHFTPEDPNRLPFGINKILLDVEDLHQTKSAWCGENCINETAVFEVELEIVTVLYEYGNLGTDSLGPEMRVRSIKRI